MFPDIIHRPALNKNRTMDDARKQNTVELGYNVIKGT
jgi:hypothetical protein